MTETTPQTLAPEKKCCGNKNGSCCSSGKKTAIVLSALLIAGLSFFAGRMTSYSHHWREARMTRMLDTMEATPEQRAKVFANYRSRFCEPNKVN